MTRDTRIALFLMGVLVTALRDNGPIPSSDRCLVACMTKGACGGGTTAGLLHSFLTEEEQDSLRGCRQPLHIG